MGKIFIYGLYEDDNYEVRYIGKTNKKDILKRLNEHILESFRNNENTHKRNWIKSVINNGKKVNIKCIEEVDENNWEERERFWISNFKNLTNYTDGGQGGNRLFYTISYGDCKNYIKELNIKSKTEWYKKTHLLPDNIPNDPAQSYLNRGWISWGDFLGTNRTQDNIKAQKYIPYDESKKWIKNNLEIYTLIQWKKSAKENKIPDFMPNRPERFYKDRGWISWGDFLSTGRIANQYKKDIFLSYKESQEFMIKNNIRSRSQFRNLQNNIPTAPDKYYKEWTTWGDFFGTGRKQDNLLSIKYLSYDKAKEWIKDNLSDVKNRATWKEYVKQNKIPEIIPNHPELYYNRKNRGWLGWKDFLSKTKKGT